MTELGLRTVLAAIFGVAIPFTIISYVEWDTDANRWSMDAKVLALGVAVTALISIFERRIDDTVAR